MKKRLYRFKILAAALAALTLSGPVNAGEPQVPFRSQSRGIVTTIGFDAEQAIVRTHLEGQGEATQLGRFTVTADVRIYVATPTGIALGTWTYTAANGDKLFAIMA